MNIIILLIAESISQIDDLSVILTILLVLLVIVFAPILGYFFYDKWYKSKWFIAWLISNFVINKIFGVVDDMITSSIFLDIFFVAILTLLSGSLYQKFKLMSYEEYQTSYDSYLSKEE
jgi:hypothetical protein